MAVEKRTNNPYILYLVMHADFLKCSFSFCSPFSSSKTALIAVGVFLFCCLSIILLSFIFTTRYTRICFNFETKIMLSRLLVDHLLALNDLLKSFVCFCSLNPIFVFRLMPTAYNLRLKVNVIPNPNH